NVHILFGGDRRVFARLNSGANHIVGTIIGRFCRVERYTLPAERADMPSPDAARARLRRSSLKARVILPPTKSPVGAMESEFGDQGNPQRDSAFNGRALEKPV
ncbi:hypothetical protein, partial [Brucella sp. NBRC 12950]|uniref:hypothetical protein n=1 Tax=Brucella sp. NBRC 12950 TaxID=2994518 RepID=UPI002554E432